MSCLPALPAARSLLPVFPLPLPRYPLPASRFPLPAACCLLPATRFPRYLLPATRFQLSDCTPGGAPFAHGLELSTVDCRLPTATGDERLSTGDAGSWKRAAGTSGSGKARQREAEAGSRKLEAAAGSGNQEAGSSEQEAEIIPIVRGSRFHPHRDADRRRNHRRAGVVAVAAHRRPDRGRGGRRIAALDAINKAQFAYAQTCGNQRYAPTLVSLGVPVPGSGRHS